MLYARFMFSVGLGLIGVCMVLKTLLDTIFAEWDIVDVFWTVFSRRGHPRRSLFMIQADAEAAAAVEAAAASEGAREDSPREPSSGSASATEAFSVPRVSDDGVILSAR